MSRVIATRDLRSSDVGKWLVSIRNSSNFTLGRSYQVVSSDYASVFCVADDNGQMVYTYARQFAMLDRVQDTPLEGTRVSREDGEAFGPCGLMTATIWKIIDINGDRWAIFKEHVDGCRLHYLFNADDEYPSPDPAEAADEVANKEDSIVVSPTHYTKWAIEPVTFIMENRLSFEIGNIVKYALRAGSKLYDGMDATQSAIADLEKVRRYAEMRINQLKGEGIL